MKTMPSATTGLALNPPGGWPGPVGGCSRNLHATVRLPALRTVMADGPAVAEGWRAPNRYAGQSSFVTTAAIWCAAPGCAAALPPAMAGAAHGKIDTVAAIAATQKMK